jgi:prepilin-type N-terminal cleavage/methylation domain-containing protein
MRRQGFSLLELMVALGVFAVVIVYLFASITTQHQTYVVVDQITETQQAARTISELMEREVRGAGYKVPTAATVCGLDNTNTADVLVISDANAIGTLDALPVNLGAAELGGGIQAVPVFGTASTAIPLDDMDIDNDGDTDYVANGGVILVDANDNNGRVACGEITAVAVAAAPATNGTLTVTLLQNYNGSLTGDNRAIPAIYYQINNQNQLLRNGQVVADDVEDLQLAFFFDNNQNDVVDANEYAGDGAAPNYNATAMNNHRLTDLRVNLVTRTRGTDPREEYLDGIGQVTENRTAASAPPAYGRRRRIHTATVRVRNAR